MQKNVAGQKIRVFAFDRATAVPVTGDAANITCKVSIDGGAATALTDTNPVEVEDGYYLFDLTQAETNGNTLDFYPESATVGVQVVVTNHDRQTVAAAGASIVAGSGSLGFFGANYFGAGAGSVSDGTTAIVGQHQIMRLIRNDSYDGTANDVKSFPVTKDYTGWTGTLTIRHRVLGTSLLSKSVSVATATSLTASLSSTDTAFTDLTSDEDFGPHPFDIEMSSGLSKQTAVTGIAIITKDKTYT